MYTQLNGSSRPSKLLNSPSRVYQSMLQRHPLLSQPIWLVLLCYTAACLWFTYVTGCWTGNPSYNATLKEQLLGSAVALDALPSTLDYATLSALTPQQRYHAIQRHGYSVMLQQKVVVAGTIRDQADYLQQTLTHLNHTLQNFNNYRLIVVENDSTDETPQILKQMKQQNPRLIPLSFKFGWNKAGKSGAFSNSRFEIMSTVRNTYLSYLRLYTSLPLTDAYSLADYNYLLVVDLDMEGGWNMDGVAYAFGMYSLQTDGQTFIDRQHQILCANGIFNTGMHFDSLAYRDSKYNNTRYDSIERWNARQIFDMYTPLVDVDSCFAGLAIYPMQLITESKCQYVGTDCEHVTFHRCLKEEANAQIAINPSLHVFYGVIWDTLLFTQYPLVTTVLMILPTIFAVYYYLPVPQRYRNLAHAYVRQQLSRWRLTLPHSFQA